MTIVEKISGRRPRSSHFVFLCPCGLHSAGSALWQLSAFLSAVPVSFPGMLPCPSCALMKITQLPVSFLSLSSSVWNWQKRWLSSSCLSSLIASVWRWSKNWLCPSCLWWFLSAAGQSSDFEIRGIPPLRNIFSSILDSLTEKKCRNCAS